MLLLYHEKAALSSVYAHFALLKRMFFVVSIRKNRFEKSKCGDRGFFITSTARMKKL